MKFIITSSLWIVRGNDFPDDNLISRVTQREKRENWFSKVIIKALNHD